MKNKLIKLLLSAKIFCYSADCFAEMPKQFINKYVSYKKDIESAIKIHKLTKYTGKYDAKVLVASIITQESSWDKDAKRYEKNVGKNAYGLMQIIPEFHPIFEREKIEKNPSYNIHAGVVILRNCLKRSNGNVKLALKKYNGSPVYSRRIMRHYKNFYRYLKK